MAYDMHFRSWYLTERRIFGYAESYTLAHVDECGDCVGDCGPHRDPVGSGWAAFAGTPPSV